MKNTVLTLIGIFLAAMSFAQTEISVDSAANYMGQNVKICSKVYGVKAFESVTLLNLGAAYPLSPLTIAVATKDNANFDIPFDNYKGEEICVTGIISEHKGKAQIILTKQEQIKIMKPTPAGGEAKPQK